MEKREEVLQWLNRCDGESRCRYTNCPYDTTKRCVQLLHADAVALLKEDERAIKFQSDRLDALLKAQEPIVPVFAPEIEMDMSHWDCGACGGFLLGNAYPNAIKYIRPQYCSHCGRKVKWE